MLELSPFAQPKKSYLEDLNVVPILDMFVAVIFFLLLSTSFIGYTKLQLPPAQISINTDPLRPPPLDPHFYLVAGKSDYEMSLSWQGSKPGRKNVKLSYAEIRANEKALREKVLEMASGFQKDYPGERTIQLGLSAQASYQVLIDVMDGLRTQLPDIVLLSYDDASGMIEAQQGGK